MIRGVGEASSGVVRLEPMTWADFDPWSERSVRGFAAQQVAAGLRPPDEAQAYAAHQLRELLPAGLATPLHLFWTVRAAGPDAVLVGYLWLRVRPLVDEVEAYVFDVEILPAVRGRGLGRAAMLAGEHEARARGAGVIRLTVFGHNTVARRLYERLGYTVTSTALADRASADGEGLVTVCDEEARATCEQRGFVVRAQRMAKAL